MIIGRDVACSVCVPNPLHIQHRCSLAPGGDADDFRLRQRERTVRRHNAVFAGRNVQFGGTVDIEVDRPVLIIDEGRSGWIGDRMPVDPRDRHTGCNGFGCSSIAPRAIRAAHRKRQIAGAAAVIPSRDANLFGCAAGCANPHQMELLLRIGLDEIDVRAIRRPCGEQGFLVGLGQPAWIGRTVDVHDRKPDHVAFAHAVDDGLLGRMHIGAEMGNSALLEQDFAFGAILQRVRSRFPIANTNPLPRPARLLVDEPSVRESPCCAGNSRPYGKLRVGAVR